MIPRLGTQIGVNKFPRSSSSVVVVIVLSELPLGRMSVCVCVRRRTCVLYK